MKKANRMLIKIIFAILILLGLFTRIKGIPFNYDKHNSCRKHHENIIRRNNIRRKHRHKIKQFTFTEYNLLNSYIK